MGMNKVEIDVVKEHQIKLATELIHQHLMPGIVVPPDLAMAASVARAMVRGKHKIYVMVDWPQGSQYAQHKFRGVPTEALRADGFEVLLTPSSNTDIRKEVQYLSSFFIEHFPPTVELRYVLGWFAPGREERHMLAMLDAFKTIPTPQMVRLTHLTKVSAANGSLSSHKELISKARAVKRVELKLSGNVDMYVWAGCTEIPRFACSLEQARALQKALSDKGLERLKQDLETSHKSGEED